jgi:chaperonin GroEL
MSGYNVVFLTTGLKKIAYFLLEKTAEFAVPVSNSTQLFGLLKTCLGKKVTPQIFSLLKRGIEQIGRDGLLLLEENVSTEHDIEIVQGIELDKGYASSYFVNDLKNFEVNYDNPYILLLRTPLTSMNQIRPVIDYIKENNKPLIIVVEEIQKDILSSLVLNSIQKKIKVAVVKYTAIKFMKNGLLEDLALLTHSNYFEENLKVSQKNFSVQDLGQAKKVIIKKDKSTFLISKFSRVLVNRRINELNRELLLTDSDYEKSLLKTRIARLAGQIAKIKLGSSNQYELDELKLKVEKCLQTVKSSLEEGILPGAGSFYLTLNNQLASWASFNLLGEEILAASIVNSALQRPTRQLLTNANILSPSLVNQIEELGYPYAYDVVEQTNVESFQHGLVDSAKSIRATLWNSITIVSSILTSY